MDKAKEYIRISELIARKVSNTNSEEEDQELNKWLSEDSSNVELYRQLYNELRFNNKLNAYQHLDASKAWEKLNTSIASRKGRRITMKHWYRIAAAVLIPLMVVSGLLLLNNQSIDTSNQLANEISPGSSKAVLLIDGKQVLSLSDEQDTTLVFDDAMSIQNKQAALTYVVSTNLIKDVKQEWHTVVVPNGGEYKLGLADGTIVWLNSDSQLDFTNTFSGDKRVVRLKGEAYFDVSHNPEKPFIVETQDMNVRVYGTEFNVKTYANETTSHTTLVEGSVGVTLSDDNDKEFQLEPDMQFSYNKPGAKGEIRRVKASQFTGWKDGLFQFNDENLESVLNTLSRWYNVDIKFTNSAAKEIRFSGEIKRLSELSQVLDLLELGSGLEFNINNRIVEVISHQ